MSSKAAQRVEKASLQNKLRNSSPSVLGFFDKRYFSVSHYCSFSSPSALLFNRDDTHLLVFFWVYCEIQLMPKKSSSKTPSKKAEKEEVEEPVLGQKKSSSTPKKAGNEIDEIFAGKKRKKPEQKKADKPNGDEISKPKPLMKKKNKKSEETKEEGSQEPSSRPRKRTADGFAIYTEEELGINKSDVGSTPLCPFDCDCCF
ncbi:hypothetical protein QUC31_020562 [Theobroma cacao]